jgi:hypothetical protein
MKPIDQRLITLRRGVLACMETPGKTGRFVQLPDSADSVLVGGDLHGHMENLRRLVQLADLVSHPRRHLVIQELVHGPFRYSQGGDKSHQLVEAALALMVQFPGRVHYLLGNHELAQRTNRRIGKLDAEDLNDQFRLGVHTAYGERADEVYAVYEKLFDVAPLAIRTANRIILSHSLPARPFDRSDLLTLPTPLEQYTPGGSLYALVWGRDTSEQALQTYLDAMEGDWLISGHIPNDAGFERPSPRHLILDCKGSPAACALLGTEQPVSAEAFAKCQQLWETGTNPNCP